MVDGAAFIGVGFDGRGKYSPESRKMSIIQRSCSGGSRYEIILLHFGGGGRDTLSQTSSVKQSLCHGKKRELSVK